MHRSDTCQYTCIDSMLTDRKYIWHFAWWNWKKRWQAFGSRRIRIIHGQCSCWQRSEDSACPRVDMQGLDGTSNYEVDARNRTRYNALALFIALGIHAKTRSKVVWYFLAASPCNARRKSFESTLTWSAYHIIVSRRPLSRSFVKMKSDDKSQSEDSFHFDCEDYERPSHRLVASGQSGHMNNDKDRITRSAMSSGNNIIDSLLAALSFHLLKEVFTIEIV